MVEGRGSRRGEPSGVCGEHKVCRAVTNGAATRCLKSSMSFVVLTLASEVTSGRGRRVVRRGGPRPRTKLKLPWLFHRREAGSGGKA